MSCEQQFTHWPESATLIPCPSGAGGFQEGERASTHARSILGSTPVACVARGVPMIPQAAIWSTGPLTPFGPDLAQG